MSDDNHLKEQEPDYDKVEMDHLKEALKRSYKERFLFATTLYKIQKTLEKAHITHKAFKDPQ